MRPGTKSLVEGIDFLSALHSQILNIPDVRQQKLDRFGIMCPRWAVTSEASEADTRALMVDVVRRRAMQSVPVMSAIKVLRELLQEHGMSQSVPASELGPDGDQPCG